MQNLMLTIVLVVLAMVSTVSGQDLEPRAYVNTPVGMNFLIAGYAHTEGGVATDPAVPLENAQVSTNGTFLAYVRSLDIWGRSGKIDMIFPYAWMSGKADFLGEVSGTKRLRLGRPTVPRFCQFLRCTGALPATVQKL